MLSELKPIHVYTRNQLFADGFLIDLMKEFSRLVEKAGFVVPLAMSAAAYGQFVGPEDPDECANVRRLNLVKILIGLLRAVRTAGDNSELNFPFTLYEQGGPVVYELKSVIGPDDDGNPCITLMFPDED